jgi:hypothetical protein
MKFFLMIFTALLSFFLSPTAKVHPEPPATGVSKDDNSLLKEFEKDCGVFITIFDPWSHFTRSIVVKHSVDITVESIKKIFKKAKPAWCADFVFYDFRYYFGSIICCGTSFEELEEVIRLSCLVPEDFDQILATKQKGSTIEGVNLLTLQTLKFDHSPPPNWEKYIGAGIVEGPARLNIRVKKRNCLESCSDWEICYDCCLKAAFSP